VQGIARAIRAVSLKGSAAGCMWRPSCMGRTRTTRYVSQRLSTHAVGAAALRSDLTLKGFRLQQQHVHCCNSSMCISLTPRLVALNAYTPPYYYALLRIILCNYVLTRCAVLGVYGGADQRKRRGPAGTVRCFPLCFWVLNSSRATLTD
jgi:hypothetical protein